LVKALVQFDYFLENPELHRRGSKISEKIEEGRNS